MNFVQTKIYSVSQSVKNLAIQSENKEKVLNTENVD